MKYSVALSTVLDREIVHNIVRTDGQEDLTFALWYPSYGKRRTTALIYKLILPGSGDRKINGNVSFYPQYFERAIEEALKAKAGLALIHSHLSDGWQGLSSDDIKAESSHAGAVKAATGLSFVGITVGTDGAYSARFWFKESKEYEWVWCENVRVAGKRMKITIADEVCPKPRFKKELERTISAWGEGTQETIARLRIGIMGTGSVGSIIAETLARIGVQNVTLIDFDSVEIVNLDRLLHATQLDALVNEPKVKTIGRALKRNATSDNFSVEEIEYSVAEEEGFKAALDCDVLFCCVDRPLGRYVLNHIAYSHLIPVVDGGIAIRTSAGHLTHADWRAHIASPERKCLACIGQYDSGQVQADREGYFDDPKYINGLDDNHFIKHNENVFPFSLSTASFQVIQMLKMIIAPSSLSDNGQELYHFVTGEIERENGQCGHNCLFLKSIALGDTKAIVYGKHKQAEKARLLRRNSRVPLKYWLLKSLKDHISDL